MVWNNIFPCTLFFLFMVGNILFWSQSRYVQSVWPNVPPVPKADRAGMLSLGDNQIMYRAYAMMLQNLGSTGGRKISFKDYDFEHLKEWFLLEDSLDPVSDAIPMLAAYYYGAVNNNEKLNYVLDYLSIVGQRPEGEKFRWLGHAVYLARHQQQDNEKALELAYKLAANKDPNLSDWAKQMPAFVLQAQGETELAYHVMLNILVSEIDTLHPNEIFYMKDYICNTLLKDRPNLYNPDLCGR